jgi:hypothetical protein
MRWRQRLVVDNTSRWNFVCVLVCAISCLDCFQAVNEEISRESAINFEGLHTKYLQVSSVDMYQIMETHNEARLLKNDRGDRHRRVESFGSEDEVDKRRSFVWLT